MKDNCSFRESVKSDMELLKRQGEAAVNKCLRIVAIAFTSLLIIIIFLAVHTSSQVDLLEDLYSKQQEQQETQKECVVEEESKVVYISNDLTFTLDNCPFCGVKVECYPVVDSWCIKCPECELKTDYFKVLPELVSYWNKE